MKRLNPVGIPLQTWYMQILNVKNNSNVPLLKSIEADVSKSYSIYYLHFNNNRLENIEKDALFQLVKDMISGCYDNATIPLGLLKTSIIDNQHDDLKGTCQYCGIRTPDSFDHYIPVSDFPEYCVLELNMIPCCTICNSVKNRYWREDYNGVKARTIINFYLNDVPNLQVLELDLDVSSGFPLFNFFLNSQSNISTNRVFKRHFERLGLLKQYNTKAISLLISICEDIACNHPGCINIDPIKVTEYLTLKANSMAKRLGVNNWQSVVYRAIAADINLVNYVISASYQYM